MPAATIARARSQKVTTNIKIHVIIVKAERKNVATMAARESRPFIKLDEVVYLEWMCACVSFIHRSTRDDRTNQFRANRLLLDA